MEAQNIFEQIGAELDGLLQEDDFLGNEIAYKKTFIRIAQPNTEQRPEGVEDGQWYAKSGMVTPTGELIFTPLRKEIVGKAFWTPWTGKTQRHKLCEDMGEGYGIVYVQDSEGRWIPGDVQRNCFACPHNRFRHADLPPLPCFDGRPDASSSDGQCKGWMAILCLVHDSVSSPASFAVPAIIQLSTWVLSSEYKNLPQSWDRMRVDLLKRSRSAIQYTRIKAWTEERQTGGNRSYVPLFVPVGTIIDQTNRQKSYEAMRALVTEQRNQLMLAAASVLEDAPALEESTGGNGTYEPVYTGQPQPENPGEVPF